MEALEYQLSLAVISMKNLILLRIVFPRIKLGATISFFASKGDNYSREGNYSREAIISNISH